MSVCKKCKRKYANGKYLKNKKKHTAAVLNSKLKRDYGITLEQYDEMFEKQKGLCMLCGKSETKTHPKTGVLFRLSVDHNHKTGQIRKLLCARCNLFVGQVENNLDLIKAIIKYLRDCNG